MKKVAIQGFEGCFHHIAAEGFFGRDIEIVSCANFRAVARTLESGGADLAMMAIENSIAGSILSNYKILQNSKFRVIGEVYLQIRQNLLALPGVKLGDIREVQSHSMALQQCSDFLDDKGWRLVETEDTAFSARHVAESGLRDTAAVAGDLPARLYGLEILVPGINTMKNNHTRFLALERLDDNQIEIAGINKASLCFQVSHNKGSLVSMLRVLEENDLNMSKLQSYPIPSDPWHYMFHLDLEFDDPAKYRSAFGDMVRHCSNLTVYGEYAKGINI